MNESIDGNTEGTNDNTQAIGSQLDGKGDIEEG